MSVCRKEHPESYYSFMHRNFFDHVDIPAEKHQTFSTANAPDIRRECASYEEKNPFLRKKIHLFMGRCR